MKAAKYKKFIDDGKGNCVYCHERRYDCCCDEKTARSLGFSYVFIPVTRAVERPPMPEGLTTIEKLTFLVANPTSKKELIGVWKKGNALFKNGYDLVDYYNRLEAEAS